MNKKIRQQVYDKYGGKCAYTGKPLADDWQVDHATPKYKAAVLLMDIDVNAESNLIPALKIVNHYKRSLDIEDFRRYLSNFHIRLSKLPKKTTRKETEKRIAYMNTIAQLFDITPDKPFSGVFYFETITTQTTNNG